MHVVKNDAKGKLLRPVVAQPNGFSHFGWWTTSAATAATASAALAASSSEEQR